MYRLLVVLVLAVITAAQSHERSDTRDEKNSMFWVFQAQDAIRQQIANGLPQTNKKARNIVLFVGSGMSLSTIAAARILQGQRQGKNGEETELPFETFPSIGLAKTYCVDSQIPDAACSATAIISSVKTNRGVLGLSASIERKDCISSLNNDTRPNTFANWAKIFGREIGLVSTSRITYPLPACVYGHSPDSEWENDALVRADGVDPDICPDIAHQLIHENPGDKLKVILGGGRREFLPKDVVDEEGTPGKRTDGRNLIDEWKKDKVDRKVSHQFIWNREQLLSANDSLPEYLFGLFEGSHLQYNLEANRDTEPTLAELTDVAIRSLKRYEGGFYLFVEHGKINQAHQENRVEVALDETLELAAAVKRATELLSEEDSLIVVTSDHSNTMAFNGYSARGSDILGPSGDKDADGKPYMTLSYTNGPGFRSQENGVRKDITKDSNFGTPEFVSHADIPLARATSSGEDVPVYARGPNHAVFAGVYEQHHMSPRVGFATCIAPGVSTCT